MIETLSTISRLYSVICLNICRKRRKHFFPIACKLYYVFGNSAFMLLCNLTKRFAFLILILILSKLAMSSEFMCLIFTSLENNCIARDILSIVLHQEHSVSLSFVFLSFFGLYHVRNSSVFCGYIHKLDYVIWHSPLKIISLLPVLLLLILYL